MANVVVIGAQWGDEGKGKIVDWLCARARCVVRFQGGHNAGHTLVIRGTTYKLSLLPSGIVRRGKRALIGNGVVIDPWVLLAEMARLRRQGVQIGPHNLQISEQAALILPFHAALDAAREQAAPTARLGTTKRGIGPAYEDKVARRALRMADLAEPQSLEPRLAALLQHHNGLRRGFGLPPIEAAPLLKRLRALAPRLLPYLGTVWQTLQDAQKRKQPILFEGAQGAMLDLDHGTYPFVTSSHTHAAAAALGAGVPLAMLEEVLGITKAYATRVGEGPFPTEQANALGRLLGERGKEFGTVTGRKRRCGWFDAVLVRQAVLVGGITGLALTKLDVLDGLKEVKICIGYRLDGKKRTHLPAAAAAQARCTPIYETLPGWSAPSRGLTRWDALPRNAVRYVRRLEALVGAPVRLLSTSPRREDTILVRDPFAP